MKTFKEYQDKAAEFAIYPKDKGLAYVILGITSEVGEFAGKVKKVLRDKNGAFEELDILALEAELGDILWYAASLASELGASLEDIAEKNIEKLSSRKQRDKISGSGDDR